MKKIILLLVALFMFQVAVAPAWAASPWTTKSTYSEKMMGKLGFGLKNTLLGFTEIIKQPIVDYKGAEHNKLGNGVLGLGKGLVNGVVYTVGGVLHLVTFPLTMVDIPLPHDGVHCDKCPLGKMGN